MYWGPDALELPSKITVDSGIKAIMLADDGPKVTGVLGINPSQFLSLIHPLDQLIRRQLPCSHYPGPPRILTSKAIVLAVESNNFEALP